jgi:hypothetical protein
MRRLPALIMLILIALLTVSCNDDATEAETTSVPTDAVSSTTAVTVETTTTTMPTTTMPTTTTTEAVDEEAWVDGDTVLIVGDCYTEAGTGDETTRTKVPCDELHYGEVLATGLTACPAGLDTNEFTALMSDYVGVAAADLSDWMDQESVTATGIMNFDDGFVVGTLCALVAEEGDLARSYRSG